MFDGSINLYIENPHREHRKHKIRFPNQIDGLFSLSKITGYIQDTI